MDQKTAAPLNELQAAAERKPKKSAGKILNTVLNVVLVLLIIFAALSTYVSFVSTSGNGVPNLFGMEIFSVQTDSMYPTLKAGDLIISHAVRDSAELQVGDIITYWTIINGERALNTHRIHGIYDGGDYLIFETKGDNNSIVDSLTVHEAEVVGKYSARVGGLGKVMDYLQTSTGFLLVVVIPVALFFLYQLVQFFRVLFEYQSVKNRLKFEEEQMQRLAALGIDPNAVGTPAPAAQAPPTAAEEQSLSKDAIKAELREQLKAEMMAEMLAELKKQGVSAVLSREENENPSEEQKAEETVKDEAPEELPEEEDKTDNTASQGEESAEEPETAQEEKASEEDPAPEEEKDSEEGEPGEEATSEEETDPPKEYIDELRDRNGETESPLTGEEELEEGHSEAQPGQTEEKTEPAET